MIAGLVILLCLLLLVVLFVMLRYDDLVKRTEVRGAPQEPLRNAVVRGLRRDLGSLFGRLQK